MAESLPLPFLDDNEKAKPPRLQPEISPYIAISGHVELTQLEHELVDTPEFQRLRRLKQLGTSYLVFPSAVHTRFDHTLGCLSRLSQMIKAIRTNPASSLEQKAISEEQEQYTRLVALLHDIGNLPFGHTLEDESRVIEEGQDDRARFERLFASHGGKGIGAVLHAHLGSHRVAKLLSFLTTPEERLHELGDEAFISDLVKNTLSADLLDYLWRDPYFSGLPYRVGDDFLRYLYLDYVEDATSGRARRPIVRVWKEETESLRKDTLRELIDLLHLRYTLSETIYFHHAKVASGAMLARAVHDAIERPSNKEPLDIDRLLTMGDDELLSYLVGTGPATSSLLATMIRDRRIYKRAWKYSASQNEPGSWVPIRDLPAIYREPTKRHQMENELAARIGQPPGHVLLYCPDPKMQLKAARMWILWKGKPIRMEDIDDTVSVKRITSIADSHRALWTFWVFVHPDVEKRKVERLGEYCAEFRTGRVPLEVVKAEAVEMAVEAKVDSASFPSLIAEVEVALAAAGTRRDSLQNLISDIVQKYKRVKR